MDPSLTGTDTDEQQASPPVITMNASDFEAAPSTTAEPSIVTMKASDFEQKPAPIITMNASEFAAPAAAAPKAPGPASPGGLDWARIGHGMNPGAYPAARDYVMDALDDPDHPEHARAIQEIQNNPLLPKTLGFQVTSDAARNYGIAPTDDQGNPLQFAPGAQAPGQPQMVQGKYQPQILSAAETPQIGVPQPPASPPVGYITLNKVDA